MSPRQPQHITRRNLLDATIALFAEKGIAATTTAEVSKRAGVATGTLFNHFATKAELTEAVYLHLKQFLADQIEGRVDLAGSPQSILRSVWHGYLAWALEHPAEYSVLTRLKTYAGLSEATRQQGDATFAFAFEAMEKAVLDAPEDVLPDGLPETLFLSMAEGTISFLDSKNGFDPKVADRVFELLWQGLAGPAPG